VEVKEQFKSYYHFHKDKGEDFQHGGQRVKGIFKQSTDLRPLISVITAVYNGGQYLEESIDSIKTQNYQNFEHIIIDGCSTDKTPDIIKRNENNIDYWISEKDKGIYDAFNKGLKLAKGDYIVFVNSDDKLYDNNVFSTVIKYFKNNKDLDFLFGPVKKHWGLLHGYKPWKIRFSWGFYSSHSTGFFIKKNAAKKIGFYNLAYKYSSDYDYFYRMIVKLKMRGTSTKKDEIFGIFRRGGFSSKINFIDHFFETIKIRLDNGQNKFLVLLIFILKYLKNNQKF
tara:strand:+ start:690 stop:1535 length:846 start_codon:yes stop_codon:yes gene_type:complete